MILHFLPVGGKLLPVWFITQTGKDSVHALKACFYLPNLSLVLNLGLSHPRDFTFSDDVQKSSVFLM